MTISVAEETLKKAKEFGMAITVTRDGALKWTSGQPPPLPLIADLRAHKPQIIEILSSNKKGPWVMRLKIGGTPVIAIDTISPDLESAIGKQQQRWGSRLTEISAATPSKRRS